MTEQGAPRRRRRIWPWIVLAGVLWLGAAVVLVGLGVLAAANGADELVEARAGFELTDLASAEPDRTVDRAADEFARSERLLGHPVVAPARLLPVVGRQIRSAHALADAASTSLDQLVEVRDGLRSRTEDGLPGGEDRIELLRWLRDALDDTRETLATIDLGPDEALVGPLDTARSKVDANLALVSGALDDSRTGLGAALSLFSNDSRYLVVAANNAEMRVGSGMFLSLGPVEIRGGEIEVGSFEPTAFLGLEGRVPAPDEVESLWGWTNPGQEWRNLGLTPDFTVNGAMAAQMWSELGRPPVDGVLLVDVVAIERLLKATGPVEVEGVRIDADNVRELLLHDQYLDVDDRDANAERREELAAVAASVLDALDRPGLDLGALATAMQEAQRGRHLLAWSSVPEQQAGWETFNIDGDLDADEMMVALANIDLSKMDPFMRVDAVIDAVEVDADASEVTIRVEVLNRTPADEPAYIRGRDPQATYDGLVVAYLPAWAGDLEVDGTAEIVASGREDGNLVVGVRVSVPRNEQRSVTLRFGGPTDAVRDLSLVPSARVPAVDLVAGGREFTDRRPRQFDPHAR